MSQLAASQAAFFAGLKPEADDAALKAAAGLLDGSAAMAGLARLEVYRDMYVARLTDALRIDFEQTHKLLGPAHFAELARSYIIAHPPRTPSLDGVGQHLADHIDTQGAWRVDLGDLARLEWARIIAAHKRMSPPKSFADWLGLGAQQSGVTKFVLSPSLALIQTRYAACALWRALEHGKDVLEPTELPSYVAVWRDHGVVAHKALPPRDARALGVLQQGGDFIALCEVFVQSDSPSQHVAACMQQFFAAGFIVGFDMPASVGQER